MQRLPSTPGASAADEGYFLDSRAEPAVPEQTGTRQRILWRTIMRICATTSRVYSAAPTRCLRFLTARRRLKLPWLLRQTSCCPT